MFLRGFPTVGSKIIEAGFLTREISERFSDVKN